MENYDGKIGAITVGVLKKGLKPTTTNQLVVSLFRSMCTPIFSIATRQWRILGMLLQRCFGYDLSSQGGSAVLRKVIESS